MIFSDTSQNKSGLIQDINFICSCDDYSYPIADKTRNINEELYNIGILMWQFSPSWHWDDANLTTHPILLTDLIDNKPDYTLETNIIHLERVSVKKKGGDWVDLKFVPFSRIPSEFNKNKGLPSIYSIKGNSLFLFPPPSSNDVTLQKGLKIYITRIANDAKFVTTDTLKEPGFNPAFHRLLSLKASLMFLLSNDLERYNRVKLEYNELLNSFVEWLKLRQAPNREQVLKPRTERYD